MKASVYTKGFRDALQGERVQKYANICLSITVLLLGVLAFHSRERIVIVPPLINEKLELSYDAANAEYYKSWALYVATFMGNVNPGNATFLAEGLSKAFTPELYTPMRQRIIEQAEELRMSGRSVRFYPDRVLYENESGKTFVTGKQEIASSSGAVKEQEVVYEMLVKIRSGMPMVSAFDYYTGAPRTVEWLGKHGGGDSAGG